MRIFTLKKSKLNVKFALKKAKIQAKCKFLPLKSAKMKTKKSKGLKKTLLLKGAFGENALKFS